MCNGSKSHKPFSINNCNGVTGFFAVFSGIPGEMFGVAASGFNPNGIEAFSPGLRASRYPG
jgi:hypothetical protein